MFDIPGAIREVFGFAREIFAQWTTRDRRRLEAELEELNVQKRLAKDRGDLVAVNQYESDAQRLRKEIAAKYPAR